MIGDTLVHISADSSESSSIDEISQESINKLYYAVLDRACRDLSPDHSYRMRRDTVAWFRGLFSNSNRLPFSDLVEAIDIRPSTLARIEDLVARTERELDKIYGKH